MTYPKRLIEVDLPIKRISEHARREKSIRHGHISTLHIWWARRPLAACRAVICAALWPDPADPLCPQRFRDDASHLINEFAKRATTDRGFAKHCSPENWVKWQTLARNGGLDPKNKDHWNVLRITLLDFIADFANWDNSTVAEYVATSRALTRSAHEVLGGAPSTRPLVVDPFAGGGSIPLEALRVGADAFASDLNPVAVLLNKVLLEYIPKYGKRLANEVGKYGGWVKEQAAKELAEFYPKDPDGATPIAYLWARTITCEGPGCGVEVPLMRSLWLAKKDNRSLALRLVPNTKKKCVDLEILQNVRAKDVGEGTVRRGSASCPLCGFTTPVASVRRQLKRRKGGASDARMLCVVTTHPEEQGRFYRLPSDRDLEAVRSAERELQQLQRKHEGSLSLIPDERFPPSGLRRIQVPNYGIEAVGDMFTPRQALAIVVLAACVRRAIQKIPDDGEFSQAVHVLLSLLIDKQIDLGNSLNRWEPVAQCPRQLFARQSVPIVWDFAEGVPIGDSSGSWHVLLRNAANILGSQAGQWPGGHAQMASALKHPLPNDAAQAVVTDPPYYDSVVYAHTADVFYPWLRRQLSNGFPELFSTDLSPKDEEIVVDPPHSQSRSRKDSSFFESKMTEALAEARRILSPAALAVVVFAHQSTAGWEAMVNAILDAGWTITASWPIDTEMATRVLAQNRSVLASSVHLACRPRAGTDTSGGADLVGDWRDVLAELPRRIQQWMPRLGAEGVVGADAIFACLGPALEIFSRYSRVEKASGERVLLKEYLEYVWAAVAKEALSMIFVGADATGFEEDARLTAMWLWTLSTGANGNGAASDETEDAEEEDDDAKKGKLAGYVLEYDAARKIAQGLGARLERLMSLVEVKGDKARLFPVSERARYLFGKDEGAAPARHKAKTKQLSLLDELGELEEEGGGWGEKGAPKVGSTVLDRVHQSMILFAAGRNEALKRFLVTDGAGQDRRFWHLADALCKLYPRGTDERRWVEGVMARKKGLGF
jgi:adenine-specific DNA methylase